MAQSKFPYQWIFRDLLRGFRHFYDKKAIASWLIKLLCVREVTLKEYRHNLLKSVKLKSNGYPLY
ncbi:hypothetical protein H6H01_17525 [Nostoc calcicola FACHB-3891]|nr:hypothetical protein [Nostoc calcicola FACHB-3891]